MRHDEVDAVSFTGSVQVGNMVYDAATDDQKRVQTEMGSKNPAVVTDNADLERAVELIGNGAFGVTGQACTATARAIVYESIYDEFVERIIEYAESLDIGPGVENYDMGPHLTSSSA
jgi:2,5-dioxopentanoate dehydrogenase